MAQIDENELYDLNWDLFNKNLKDEFTNFETMTNFSDVTFLCQDETFHAHKLVLHVGSAYFRDFFKKYPVKNPIFYMYHVKSVVLKKILEFLYCGEVQVEKRFLQDFIILAENLKVKGIAPNTNTPEISEKESSTTELPTKKRKIEAVRSNLKKELKEEVIIGNVVLSSDEESRDEETDNQNEIETEKIVESKAEYADNSSSSGKDEKDEKEGTTTTHSSKYFNKSYTRYKRLVLNIEKDAQGGAHEPLKGTRRRCGQCSIRKMEKRTCYYCKTCDIGLCLPCFKPFHQVFDETKNITE